MLDTSATAIHKRVVRSLVLVPYSSVRVKTDVPRSVLAYVRERPELFQGVKVEQTYLRDYPHKMLAAQILGTVGEISPSELKQKRYRGVKPGTIVGHNGLERAYDKYLRGQDGVRRVQVDANGRPIPNTRLKNSKPVAGQRVRLSVDLDLQKLAQRALGGPLNPGSNPGAAVALDPTTGEVLAMASHPTFDPTIFTKELTDARYKALVGEGKGGGPGPIFNRAISGAYPTASTFKPFSALAGLDKGLISAGMTINDGGCIQVGEIERCNAKDQAYGAVDLTRALQVSSDVYFYRLGMSAFYRGNQAHPAVGAQVRLRQDDRHRPARRVRRRDPRQELAQGDQRLRARLPQEQGHPARARTSSPPARRAAGARTCASYNLGDNASLAIGQGDVQATPLQIAVAYAALENGGKIVRPHLGLDIESAGAELIQRIERDPSRKIDIEAGALAVIRNGLHLAASTPDGTSGDVFAGWDQGRYPVFGKTGTAEQPPPKEDQSWYVAYVPDAQAADRRRRDRRGGRIRRRRRRADRLSHARAVLPTRTAASARPGAAFAR